MLEEVLEERRLGYREPKIGNNDDLLKSNMKQCKKLLTKQMIPMLNKQR